MIQHFDRICINCMREKAGKEEVCPFCGYDPKRYQPAPTHLPPFTILYGKYLLGRVIGQGGFGIVYIALDLVLEIIVAIKELFPTRMVTRTITNQSSSNTVSCTDDPRNLAAIREKFVKEARTIIRLQEQFNAEGIVQVRDLFEDNNTVYLVMEYLQGKSLKQYCEENGTIRYPQLLQMLRPIMDSLELMHGDDVLHRDISADNIMVLSSLHRKSAREIPQLKLLDFGNVKVQDSANDMSRSMVMAVKKGYSPIEQYSSEGQIGPWTDVYALCATIYYCLTGKVPPEPAVLAGTSITLPSRLGVDIPDSAEKTLMKGLAFRHSDRIQNMHDLITGLYDVIPEQGKDQGRDSGKDSGKESGKDSEKKNTSKIPAQKKSKLPFLIGIPVGAVVLIGSVMAVIYFNESGHVNAPQTESSKTVIENQSETTGIIETDSGHAESVAVLQTETYKAEEGLQKQEEIDKRAADYVTKTIKAIPNAIAFVDEEIVKNARESYYALTEAQKRLVPEKSLSKLVKLEEGILQQQKKKEESEKHAADQKAADETAEVINEIPDEITLDDQETVEAARDKYSSLSEQQKKMVPFDSTAKLIRSEDELLRLKSESEEEQRRAESEEERRRAESEEAQRKAESEEAQRKAESEEEQRRAESEREREEELRRQEEADQKAADEVTEAIKALPGKITLDDEEAVKSAREGYDSLTEEQKQMVPYLTYLYLTTSEDRLKKIKSVEEQKKKESEKQQQAIPISLSLDDFYVVSNDPESILYKGENVLTFLQDEFGGEGAFWSFSSISDMDKDYYITTNRGLNNNYPSETDILGKYGKGVDIPIDKDSDVIYQSMKENGDFEADIIDQCARCMFYNYEDQGQLVFYMNDNDQCELIIIESGISYYADKKTVKGVQKKLNSKGYDCGNPDGIAGEKTRSAVKKYQEDNGLYPSGIIDDSLMKSLEL